MNSSTVFKVIESADPHPARARRILSAHPEVRALLGRNRWTALVALALMVGLVAAAFATTIAPWWVGGLLLVPGALASHALYVVTHECAHNLVFRTRTSNRALAIVVNLVLVAPFAISYLAHHLAHHKDNGRYVADPDLPSAWEARWVARRTSAKLIWLLFNPVFQALRTSRVQVPVSRGWLVLNVVTVLAANVAIWIAIGPVALAYLATSFWLANTAPPLAARYVQEHFAVAPPQETYSYYGPLNAWALNVGYHNEHHDFPFVAWNRLAELRVIADDEYGALVSHDSWWGLWRRFVFDPQLGLLDRVERV